MSTPFVQCYIGLGSNLSHGDQSPLEVLQSSLSALAGTEGIELLQVSGIYSSSPVGHSDQPDYHNAVACISTSLSPEDLLNTLQRIEAQYGRNREQERRWGQRTLDLDILVYGDHCVATDRLKIPHCELTRRAFVLYPLQEIAPDLVVVQHGALADIVVAFEQTAESQEQQLTRLDV